MIKARRFHTARRCRLRGSEVHGTFIVLPEIKNRTAMHSPNVGHKLPSNTTHCPRMETSPASGRIPETIKVLLCSASKEATPTSAICVENVFELEFFKLNLVFELKFVVFLGGGGRRSCRA